MTHPLLRPQPPRAWQFEDLFDTPDDGYRYEIYDGCLLVTPQPPLPHAGLVFRLRRSLDRQAPQTLAVSEGIGVLRDNGTSYFVPDLVIFDADLFGRPLSALPPSAVHLVVEVVSPSNPNNDLVIKRHGYAMIGIPEYWIIDSRSREFLVLTDPSPFGYQAEEKRSGEMRGAAPFPYRLDLDALFG
ncbi:Uma2 family endonuclease [Catellatospora citrea]|uniref:Uma2 family endonuclease n=1 Tax=Catellatospora citrea TaxID=53366 RepID=UPI0033F7B472